MVDRRRLPLNPPCSSCNHASMGALIEPFSGYVPAAEFAHRVVGPPVSMLSPDQREAARLDPLSFRHVVGRGAGSSLEEAGEWMQTCREQGVLQPVGPAVFVYRLAKGDLVATGVVADVSLKSYDTGRVRRHEETIAKTEGRMADYMRSTRIYGNPVALAHRPHAAISTAIAQHTTGEPDYSFIAADGFSHSLWVIEDEPAHSLCASFDETLYITDGHHRLAAASLVAAEEGRPDPHLPAGLFAADELRLRSFARCVVDPGIAVDAVIDRLRSENRLEEVSPVEARPRGRFDFGVKIGGRSFRLHIDRSAVPDDLYGSLDVNLLQKLILEPVFGIVNPREDPRLKFIADMSDDGADAPPCDAWFLPFPTSVNDVLAVADEGRTMPPKSTWFAPKLPSGLVIRFLDDR